MYTTVLLLDDKSLFDLATGISSVSCEGGQGRHKCCVACAKISQLSPFASLVKVLVSLLCVFTVHIAVYSSPNYLNLARDNVTMFSGHQNCVELLIRSLGRTV